jgi:hypothetical protein
MMSWQFQEANHEIPWVHQIRSAFKTQEQGGKNGKVGEIGQKYETETKVWISTYHVHVKAEPI